MPYKVIDIFKDLPGTNCKECNMPGCMPFATAVFLEKAKFSDCPYLAPEQIETMSSQLAQTEAEGGRKKPKNSEQAIAFLQSELEKTDFEQAAKNAGALYLPGPPEAIEFSFLNIKYRVLKDDVIGVDSEVPNIWVKVFLMIYVTHSNGASPAGEWVAYRQLPNTTSKTQSFEHCTENLAEHFSGNGESLVEACLKYGGRPFDPESAEFAWEFTALPRVDVQLYFWDAEEEFAARASILVDRKILDHLDQEATVFLAEEIVRLLREG